MTTMTTKNQSFIANGFKKDCEQLLLRFGQVQDVRFASFCAIWKDMKFSLIFSGRPTLVELLEFCEEALHISKQFLLTSKRFKDRIGALYLLYGIYYQKPVDEFKIRIKSTDWQILMELHGEIKSGEHLDANYILSKLILDNAFHFSLFDKEFGLEKEFRRQERQHTNPHSTLPILKNLTEPDQLLSNISKLSQIYQEKKCDLSTNDQGNPSLNLFNDKIAEDIIEDIRKFEASRQAETSTRATCSSESRTDRPIRSTRSDVVKDSSQKNNTVRNKLGHGFDTESSDTEEDISMELDNYDPNLPEDFD